MHKPKISPFYLYFSVAFLFGINAHAQNSVLSSGTWHKIAVTQTGIHKITYEDLENYGIDVSQLNPKHIRIYGNGNGMLPEPVGEFRYTDLQENALFVYGEEDGVFDPGDYILFYAEGPVEWNYNPETARFEHTLNLYDDRTCYFVNTDLGEGRRIQDQPSLPISPTYISTSFDDYAFHEQELRNFLHSGKIWYGEEFDGTSPYDFVVEFPNLVTTAPVFVDVEAAARSTEMSYFDVKINEQPALSLQIPGVFFNPESDYARAATKSAAVFSDNALLDISFDYEATSASSTGWLNYFTLNAKRELIFDTGQMAFRDVASADTGAITEFRVATANPGINIWNITDPLHPAAVDFAYSSATATFTLSTDSLLNFIIFDNSTFFTPEYAGEIENQNLHGLQPPDMVIISPADFLAQARQLAGYRESHNDMSVSVVTPEEIYNEYSSGSKDITAIRDFILNLHERSNGEKPAYVLLFGDASFDYKNILNLQPTTALVPVWESSESLHVTNSYCSDDFFGTFEEDPHAMLSASIGRLPVKTTQEATAVVEKIIDLETGNESFGIWRNNIVMIADDEDGNVHFHQTELLATYLDSTEHALNLSKIYLDAYPQEFINGSFAYPQVNQAITRQINSGAGMINYVGHANYNFLAHEKVLTEADLQNWDNQHRYPVMLAASCEFGQFDDPDRYSISEQAVVMDHKGMSAVISATRNTFGSSNFTMQRTFYSTMTIHPEYPVGVILTMAKNQSNAATNNKKFILFGDPAMRLAIPEYRIATEAINGKPATAPPDTLHPGEQVIVTGNLTDREGNNMYDFNGTITVNVFNKAVTDSTLGNDVNSYPAEFTRQDSVLMEASAEVVNGQFALTFNLPTDLDEDYGKIKLSYYANDGARDAMGYYGEAIVGGQYSGTIELAQPEDFITFFPTLVRSQLYYSAGKNIQDVNIEIVNLAGNVVYSSGRNNLSGGRQQMIDVSNLPNGLYIIRAYNGSHLNHCKIVKQ